jgi:predicted nucleotidyltransferase
MDKNFLELLQSLNEHKVKYLIIGGYAVIKYTEPRYTKDLDIWVEISKQNARNILKALNKFGAPIDNLSEQDLLQPGLIYIFGLPPARIDLLNKVSGSTFQTAWKNKVKSKIKNVIANFVGVETLIKLKKASGRPQDLADLEKLKKSL